ncbi:hypothetical protein GCK72_026149 [Caenorhabditis remanei]|uniref:C2H2-type domain-containing protein n=1 Tax=Caenorhabditis remanei TaxID=31234 RepID=A0A6A5G4M9_CAERE|nr:hypothetical protein GCK72_026149 [Caenorhabditis remanei]KAF1749681.1 hypothetical protein GCK72_026149 [Caenorhabditis remanei]
METVKRIPQQKWFICTYEKQHGLRECGFYGTLPAMNEHFAEHTECYEFRCRVCDNFFVGQMEFSKHKRHRKCLAQEADRCDECGKRLPAQENRWIPPLHLYKSRRGGAEDWTEQKQPILRLDERTEE